MDKFYSGVDHMIADFQDKLDRDKRSFDVDVQNLLLGRTMYESSNENKYGNCEVCQQCDSPRSTEEHPKTPSPELMFGTSGPSQTVRSYHQQQDLPPKYGLPGLGAYEEKRKKYQAEWKKDYDQYMRENANRPRRRANQDLNYGTVDYEDVLSKKREEERNYRHYNDGLEYNLKPSRSDGNLMWSPDLGHQVSEINGMLEKIQLYNEERHSSNFNQNNAVDNYARPHSYPIESSTHPGYVEPDHRHRFPLPAHEAFGQSGVRSIDSPERPTPKSYHDDLALQVEEVRLRRQKERNEQIRLDKKFEEENESYDPWGRGGAGAPMRDRDGKVIAVRKQMVNGLASTKQYSTQKPLEISPKQPKAQESTPHYAIPRSSRITRNVEPQQNDHSHDTYRDELKRQIEEKKRREKEEKERERLEDERLFQKIQEENEKMQRDFEEELNKQKEREEERRRRNEEVRRLQEEQRKAAELTKKEQRQRRFQDKSGPRDRLDVGAPLKTDVMSKSPPLPTTRAKAQVQKPMKKIVGIPKPSKETSKDQILSQLTAMRQQLEKEQYLMQQQMKSQMQTGYEVYDHKTAKTNPAKRIPEALSKDIAPTDVPRSPVHHPGDPTLQERVEAMRYNVPVAKDFTQQDQSPTSSKERKMWPALAIALRATDGHKPLQGESLFLGLDDYETSSPKKKSLTSGDKSRREEADHSIPTDNHSFRAGKRADENPTRSRHLVSSQDERSNSVLDEFLTKNSTR